MTNEASRVFRFLRFVIPSSFVIRLPRRSPTKAGHSSFSGNRNALRKKLWILHGTRHSSSSFTVLELLVVITIIIALAGLILATVGYVQKKGARSRAEAEIAAISAAMESYKADNGIYPREAATTDMLNAQSSTNPSTYQTASLYLYKTLSGDASANLQPPAGSKSYFSFKPQMLGGAKDANGNLTSVTYIRDPFGNSYGYSTIQAATGTSTVGYNPTFDLWSTAGGTTTNDVVGWVKNW
jgi:general secretion pathway protein G